MRQPDGFSPRIRLYIRSAARIVLLAIIIQIAAPDHWNRDVASVVGIENSQAHVQHCHGAASGCADSQGGTALPIEAALNILAPSPVLAQTSQLMFSPIEAFLSQPDLPPRAS